MMEIRQFRPNEINTYQALRLEALETNPEAFLTTASDFRNMPPSELAARLKRNYESADEAMFGAFVDGKAVGMTGIIRARKEKVRHIAGVVSVYVSPDYRGMKIGLRLLESAIEFGRNINGVEQLRLGVVTENLSAIRLYEHLGFESYGVEPRALKVGDRYWDEELMMLIFDS